MEFVCKNPECPRYDQRDYYSSVSFVMRDGQPYCKQSPCPHCGHIREEVPKEAPADLSGIYFGRFRAMSKEQKQESLKRRSHEHFKKEIAPERAAKLAAVRAEGKAMMKK
jgi:hypothetical protein